MMTTAMMNEALRYIGMPANVADDETKDTVTKTFELLEKIARPRVTYKKLQVSIGEKSDERGVFFENTSLVVRSQDLEKLLAHAKACYILAATLGPEVDKQINIKQRLNMLEAVVLDACASVRIDKVCDDLEAEIGRAHV